MTSGKDTPLGRDDHARAGRLVLGVLDCDPPMQRAAMQDAAAADPDGFGVARLTMATAVLAAEMAQAIAPNEAADQLRKVLLRWAAEAAGDASGDDEAEPDTPDDAGQ